jgi:hypothetical protein
VFLPGRDGIEETGRRQRPGAFYEMWPFVKVSFVQRTKKRPLARLFDSGMSIKNATMFLIVFLHPNHLANIFHKKFQARAMNGHESGVVRGRNCGPGSRLTIAD